MRRAFTVIAVAAPILAFGHLLANPAANIDLSSPVEHLVITTNVQPIRVFTFA